MEGVICRNETEVLGYTFGIVLMIVTINNDNIIIASNLYVTV